MSLSKYRECGILKIPGLFQNWCCVACPFKRLGIAEEDMVFIMTRPFDFQQLFEAQDPQVVHLYDLYSLIQQKGITAACQTLADYFGHWSVPITHLGYYQLTSFDLECSLNEQKTQVGKLQRGNVLEVFQPEETFEITSNILEKLERDCLTVIRSTRLYPNLPIAIQDKCVTINIQDQDYNITKMENNVLSKKNINFGDHIFFFEDLCQQFVRSLLLISDVGLVVINCTKIVNDFIPGVKDLAEMLKAVYGDLTDLVVIIVYSFADFPQIGIDNKEDARSLVNNGLDDDMKEGILWLNVSSDNDAIPEEQGSMALRIKKLKE